MGCYQEEKWGGGRKQIRMSNTSDTFKYGLPAGPGISPGGLRCVFQTCICGSQRRTGVSFVGRKTGFPLELWFPE